MILITTAQKNKIMEGIEILKKNIGIEQGQNFSLTIQHENL